MNRIHFGMTLVKCWTHVISFPMCHYITFYVVVQKVEVLHHASEFDRMWFIFWNCLNRRQPKWFDSFQPQSLLMWAKSCKVQTRQLTKHNKNTFAPSASRRTERQKTQNSKSIFNALQNVYSLGYIVILLYRFQQLRYFYKVYKLYYLWLLTTWRQHEKKTYLTNNSTHSHQEVCHALQGCLRNLVCITTNTYLKTHTQSPDKKYGKPIKDLIIKYI